ATSSVVASFACSILMPAPGAGKAGTSALSALRRRQSRHLRRCRLRRAYAGRSLRLCSWPGPNGSSQQAREPAVLEHAALGLADRAVVDRVLLEVDARERGAAAPARLAEAVVDAVDGRVGGALQAQLDAALHLGSDCVCQALDLVLVELGRERVGREHR